MRPYFGTRHTSVQWKGYVMSMFPNPPSRYSTAKPMLVNEATMLSTSCLVLGVTLLVGSRATQPIRQEHTDLAVRFFFLIGRFKAIDNIEHECQLLFDTWNA